MTTAGIHSVALDHIINVSIEHLVESKTNPRKFYDDRALNELANSIREGGIHQPLIVREMFDADDGDLLKYELVTGHRRLRAAKIAGIEQVPCLVRAIGDNEVREIQVIENLQREDVHPLDEADSYAELLRQYGNHQLVAARVGKPIEFVTRRLKLTELIPLVRQAFSARLFTIDHALLMAKLGTEEQEQALRHTLNRGAGVKTKTEQIVNEAIESAKDSYWEPTSVPELRQHIEVELSLALKKAPWDLKDELLVSSAGACTTCASNTAANTALFSDLAIETATCTDAVCFNAKRKAFVELKVEATKAASTKDDLVVVQISHKHTSTRPRAAKPPRHNKGKDGACNAPCMGCAFATNPTEFDMSQVFRKGQWVEAKKGDCDHVIAGVTVDFEEGYGAPKGKPGTKKLICIAPKCKGHKKDYEKTPTQRGGSSSYDQAAEQKKREAARDRAVSEGRKRMAEAAAVVAKVSKLTPDMMRLMAEAVLPNYASDAMDTLLPGYRAKLRKANVTGAEFAKIVAAGLLHQSLRVWEYEPTQHRDELFRFAKLMGVKPEPIFESAGKKEAPEKVTAAKKGSKR